MQHLQRGLRMLKAKNINAILDFHALPGVASPGQMFAGRCTSDVQFYVSRSGCDSLRDIDCLLDGGKLQPRSAMGSDDDHHHSHGPRLQYRVLHRSRERARHGRHQDARPGRL